MELGLKGKVAVVTGAGQGLGRVMSLSLVNEGAMIVMADINFDNISSTAQMIWKMGAGAIAVKTDVSNKSEDDGMIKCALSEFKTIDILINNAGICHRTPLGELSEAEWDRVMSVNLKGAFLCSKAAMSLMKKKHYGKIINMSSAAAKLGGIAVGAHYSASKAGLICLTKSLARERPAYGVNVNAVAPGVVATEMTTQISSEQKESYKKQIPLGRMTTPEEVANVVLFLASDMAGYITGETINVNGGLLMD